MVVEYSKEDEIRDLKNKIKLVESDLKNPMFKDNEVVRRKLEILKNILKNKENENGFNNK